MAIASLDEVIQYTNIILSLQDWVIKGRTIFGKNIKLYCPNCKTSYSCKSEKTDNLLEEATKCKNCEASSVHGLYSNIQVSNGQYLVYVFPFEKSLYRKLKYKMRSLIKNSAINA